MKFVLMTTSLWSEQSRQALERLINSISHHPSELMQIHHLVLIQNWPDNQPLPLPDSTDHYRLDCLTTSQTMSLSLARNHLLEHCFHQGIIEEDDIVAYPDDDCWYPNDILHRIYTLFSEDEQLDFFFCKYQEEHHQLNVVIKTQSQASAKDLVRNASSNTLFLRGALVKKLDGFDRLLGVGAPHNGGEDLDYAIRAYLQGRKTCYCAHYLIGHRNKKSVLRGQYFLGSAMTLRRFYSASPGLCYEYLRKLAIGLILVLKQEMPGQKLISALAHKAPESALFQQPAQDGHILKAVTL